MGGYFLESVDAAIADPFDFVDGAECALAQSLKGREGVERCFGHG